VTTVGHVVFVGAGGHVDCDCWDIWWNSDRQWITYCDASVLCVTYWWCEEQRLAWCFSTTWESLTLQDCQVLWCWENEIFWHRARNFDDQIGELASIVCAPQIISFIIV